MGPYYARPDRARKRPGNAVPVPAASAGRRLWLVALAVVALGPCRGAAAAEATPWAKGVHAEARLIEGVPARPPGSGAARLAGLEIRLDPAFITYWRDPGDAGVPPAFDFAGSDNLGAAEVLYPAPEKLDEAGTVAYGYTGDVTFPIAVTPADPAKPVALHVALAYAVCHEICLPARAALALVLDGRPSAEASRVSAALAAVPRKVRLGQRVGALALLGVAPAAGGGFSVEAEAPAGAALFVEAPEPFAFAAGPPTSRPDGRRMFPVKRVDGGEGGIPPSLTLTLVAPGDPARAVEVRAQLDGAGKTP